MPLGPVFRHEMLAAGRKRRYFWARVVIGLGMLAMLGVGYQAVYQQMVMQQYLMGGDVSGVRLSISGVAMLSSTFYAVFAWTTMLAVLAITPAVAAGAIASERERRTIEYLFATDLSNTEIVFDKLAARLMTVGGMVLATLPVLALFRLLGGVPADLLLTHFAILASTATLTAAIALTVGVWCDRARNAVPRAMAAIALWLVALPATFFVGAVLGQLDSSVAQGLLNYLVTPLMWLSSITHPIVALMQTAIPNGGMLGIDNDLRVVGWVVAAQLVAAALLVGLSVLVVRRVHLRAAATSDVRAPAAGATPASRSPYERRPMLWKEMFAASVKKTTKVRAKWLRRLAALLSVGLIGGPLIGLLLGVFGNSRPTRFDDYMQMAMMLTSGCGSIVLLMMGARAAGLVSYEHERDTWLSLLTTPLPADEIVSAKTWGNFYAFRWQLVGVVLIPLAGVLLDPIAASVALGVAVVMACVGYAATTIGIAVSLRAKSSLKAVGLTVLILLGLGLFYSGFAGVLVVLAGIPDESVALFVLPPLVPMLLVIPATWALESTPGFIVATYIAGLLFYGAVGAAVTLNSTNLFDQLCGRGVGKWRPSAIGTSPAEQTG